ncbi:MAG: site-specific integrase [Candidatus Nitrosotenuis sp.]
MIADMQHVGMSEDRQRMYVRAVRQLAEHYNKAPDQITEEELRRYFLHLKNDKKWSRAGITIALCGIKFFYEKTLKCRWPIFDVVRPHAEKKLPVILSPLANPSYSHLDFSCAGTRRHSPREILLCLRSP